MDLKSLKSDISLGKSDIESNMSSDNIQPERRGRGRPPKVQKLIDDVLKSKSESFVGNGMKGNIFRSSSLRVFKSESEQDMVDSEVKDVNLDELNNGSAVDLLKRDLKNRLKNDINLIQKKMNTCLKKKE